jgi:DNA-binding transcriptional ArsR family regulator
MSSTGAAPFAMLPASAIDDDRISHAALRVLAAYLSNAGRDGWCHPKQETVAARLHMDRSTVAYHVKKLREFGYLETEKRGKLNHSHVLTPSTRSLNGSVDPIHTCDQNVLTPSTQRVDPINMYVLTPSTAEHTNVEQTKEQIGTSLSYESESATAPIKMDRALLRITDEFVEQLVTDYGPRLGGERKARDAIVYALNHKAIDKAKDKRLYLVRWLNRDVESYEERGHGTSDGRLRGDRQRVGAHANGTAAATASGGVSPFAKYV